MCDKDYLYGSGRPVPGGTKGASDNYETGRKADRIIALRTGGAFDLQRSAATPDYGSAFPAFPVLTSFGFIDHPSALRTEIISGAQ